MIIGGMWIQILRHSNTRFSNAEYACIFQESQACVHGSTCTLYFQLVQFLLKLKSKFKKVQTVYCNFALPLVKMIHFA